VLSDSPITFRLGRRGADPDGPLSSFGTNDAAEGYRIWIQLAFAEATAALRDLAARLSDLAASVFGEIDHVAMLELELEDTEPDLDDPRRELGGSPVAIGANEAPVPAGTEGSIADAQNAVEDARLRLIAVARPYLDVVADFRAQVPVDPWAALRESDRAGLVEVREPLYLIDEPERHLHPLVQAKFAAWMRDLIRVRGAQGALVTHAVAFINKADALAYVRRGGPGSSVRSCSPEELGALGAIAAQHGFVVVSGCLGTGRVLRHRAACASMCVSRGSSDAGRSNHRGPPPDAVRRGRKPRMSDRLAKVDQLLLEMSDTELAKTWARCMRQLRVRNLVRTCNSPTGDYAERICCERFGLERKGFSEKSIDAIERSSGPTPRLNREFTMWCCRGTHAHPRMLPKRHPESVLASRSKGAGTAGRRTHKQEALQGG
jgi:hypothetical protein